MKINDKIQEIRATLKNINNDEEIDKIHEILDEIEGKPLLNKTPQEIAPIIRNGYVTSTHLNYDYENYGYGQSLPGIARVELTIEASIQDLDDD